MKTLRPQEAKAYFSRDGTVSTWWDPEGDKDRYHFSKEKRILEGELTVDPAWRVLDVGCGQGRYTIWFAQQRCRVTGVDISPEMLELCRHNAEVAGVSDRVDLVLSDADNLSQTEDEGFDVVSCMGTLVHLPDLALAVGNMVKVLRPGGRFLFTLASADSLHGRLMSAYFSNQGLGQLLTRRRIFTQVARPLPLDEMIDILQRAGLSDFRLFGIGLLYVFLRPELSDRAAFRFLRRISIVEEQLKPWYTAPLLVRLSATVLGIGTRIDAAEPTRSGMAPGYACNL
jgi:SAM-dependent methyltransferase